MWTKIICGTVHHHSNIILQTYSSVCFVHTDPRDSLAKVWRRTFVAFGGEPDGGKLPEELVGQPFVHQ